MVGIIVITHGALAQELVNAAKHIYGDSDALTYIRIDSGYTLDKICLELETKIKNLNFDEYIVFTDILGGAPCTSSLRLIKKYKMCVISGVNLPMILSAIHNRNSLDFKKLIKKVVSDGKKSIVSSTALKF